MKGSDELMKLLLEAGIKSSSLRDAVHEASHALECGCEDWGDREEIHRAVLSTHPNPAEQVREEVEARATEWEAAEMFGIEYCVEDWAMVAGMEAIKTGVSMPYDAWVLGIKSAKSVGVGAKRLERLLKHLNFLEGRTGGSDG